MTSIILVQVIEGKQMTYDIYNEFVDIFCYLRICYPSILHSSLDIPPLQYLWVTNYFVYFRFEFFIFKFWIIY